LARRTVARFASMAWAALLLITSLPSAAEVSQRDLQVLARALGFLQPPRSGDLRLGLVHDPGNAASLRQAEDIATLLSATPRLSTVLFRPVLVPLAEADRAPVDVFLLTEYLGAEAQALAAVSADRRLPCVTTDLAQVRAGACALGIQSQPKVQIVAHRGAAADSALTFATAFRMMIMEL